MTSDPERLSKLLWDAREGLDQLIDSIERRGQRATYLRRLVHDIDAYRAEQGWSPWGFGGEDTPDTATWPPAGYRREDRPGQETPR